MTEHLGVCLGLEDETFGLKFMFKLDIILDYAVVDQYYPAGPVRMGVFIGGLSMSSPAGMADGGRAFDFLGVDDRVELLDLTLAALDIYVAVGEISDTGRIISPVFQPLEAFHHYRDGFSVSDISNDAAHV